MNMEWWHWLVGGVGLILMELMIQAFFIVWFGCGALFVALLMLLLPDLPLAGQLGVWTVASVAMTVLWFRVFQPRRQKSLIGSASGEVIGEIGLLVRAVAPFERGRVRFQRPILGAEEWICLAESDIPAGERVKVVAIEGSFLKVAKA